MKTSISAALALVLTGCTGITGPGNAAAQASSNAPAATSEPQTAEDTTIVNRLPLERLFQSPSLNGPSPRALKFSPDGTKVSFLKPREDDANRLDLWAFDVATGQAEMLVDSTVLEPEDVELSEQEKALRERQRIAGTKGIVSYDWGGPDTLLVPLGGDLYLVTLQPEPLRGDLDFAFLPKAEELGITFADISERVRQSYFGEERPGEERDRETRRADLDKLLIRAPDGQEVPIKDLVLIRETFFTPPPTVRRLTETDAFEFDAKVSPAGKYVSFIRDNALFAIDLETGDERQLTPDADAVNAISYGVAEFVAQEEMSRYTGYWWSPDDRYVAYTRVDESTVDIVPRFDIAADKVTVIEQRYPKAGRPNAVVDLLIHDLEENSTEVAGWRQDAWGPATDQYLARVSWVNHWLFIQAVNRDQTELAHLVASAGSGVDLPETVTTDTLGPLGLVRDERALLYTEDQPTWINLNATVAPYGDMNTLAPAFLLTSETSGFRHIYAGSFDPSVGDGAPLTSGDWPVDQLLHIHTHTSSNGSDQLTLFFTAYKDTPLERHLYRVTLDPTGEPPRERDIQRITPAGASWSITMAPDGASYIGTSSKPSQPPQTALYKTDGTRITWIEENALTDTEHPYHPYLEDHTVPTFGTLTAEDGQTLYYSLQLPPDFDENTQYPVIVEVYGGPHVQRVSNSWRPLSDQYLTREGYIVFRLDNRGSDNRGRDFENVIYRRTGGPEVRDQLTGVNWLKARSFVDPERIAIQGWSYGGYMTLMTLLQAEPGTF
ncbi:MAG: DPP IV N-terminal domain-containing protein, partial [Pseudomonadota bacterium]